MQVADCVFYVTIGPYLDEGRNDCVRQFLLGPFEQCRFLLMIDSDIAFKPEDVAALASHDLPVVSGVYHSWFQGSPTPVLYNWAEEPQLFVGKNLKIQLGHHFVQVKGWDDGWPYWPHHRDPVESGVESVVPIAGFGGGFLMIRRDVLEQMGAYFGEPQPWFAEDVIATVHYGEDLCFAKRLHEIGIPAYADRSVQVTHYKTMPL